MSEDVLNHVVYSGNVLEFVTVSGEFCKLLESAGQLEFKEFLSRLQKITTLLYLKVALLPEVEEMQDDAPEKFVTEEDYNYLQHTLKGVFGAFDEYQEVFDPMMQYSETPLPASLSENMADIYQDVKDFILAYRIGTLDVMNDALGVCRNNFAEYWGQKLVNALRAIHHLLYSGIDLSEEKRFEVPDLGKAKESDNLERQWGSHHFHNHRKEE